ncbi:MAG TPA: hypothetical protein PLP27_00975 [Crocinitomicaceae bacterium]|nr:hypothetical protein [Crocinitomicaceae bacterium]
MKQTLFSLLFSTLFLSIACTNNKTNDLTEKEKRALIEKETETKIVDCLSQLSNYQFYETPDFNIDSLNQIATEELAKYLKHKPFPINTETTNLEQITSPDNKFSIYTFWYYSGGTAGAIHTSILQWKKADGTYNVKELGFPAYYNEIYALTETNSENLYLLFGGYKGSSRLRVGIYQVFELSQDSINVNYPAFYDQYSTLVCFDDVLSPELPSSNCFETCVTYSKETKELNFKDIGKDDDIHAVDDDTWYNSNQDIIKSRTKIRYVFDGKKFVERD